MKNISKHLVPNLGTLVILGLFLAVQATGVFGAPNQLQVADVPTTIGYQGQLTDGSGNPVPDGTYTMRFRIYDDATSGTDLWTEYQDVTITDGQFDVLLGSVTPLSGSLFDSSQRWLAIKVDSDLEMTPRQPLSSVPFSLRADVADASITTEKLADGAVTQNGQANESNVVSRQSTTYGDLDGMTVTLDTTGGDLLIYFTGSCMHTTAGYWLQYRIVVDGVAKVERQVRSTTGGASSEIGTPIAIVWRQSGLPAGSHTVKVQWRTDSGGSGIGYTSYRTLSVVELKK